MARRLGGGGPSGPMLCLSSFLALCHSSLPFTSTLHTSPSRRNWESTSLSHSLPLTPLPPTATGNSGTPCFSSASCSSCLRIPRARAMRRKTWGHKGVGRAGVWKGLGVDEAGKTCRRGLGVLRSAPSQTQIMAAPRSHLAPHAKCEEDKDEEGHDEEAIEEGGCCGL